MASGESSLLGLSEVFINVAVEFGLSNISNRYELLGPDFGRIEHVEFKVMFLRFLESLDAKLPYWEDSLTDSFVKIFTVKIKILAGQFQRLIPYEGVDAKA